MIARLRRRAGADLVASTGRVPAAFVPDEDEGYFIVIVQAPAGASLEYTTNIAGAGREDPAGDAGGRRPRSRSTGFSFSGAAPNNGHDLRPAEAIRRAARARRTRCRPWWTACAGRCSAFPARSSCRSCRRRSRASVAFGGFQFEVLDQTRRRRHQRPGAATSELVGAGQPERPRLHGPLHAASRADDPQLVVDDRPRQGAQASACRSATVTDALQVFLGSAVRQRLRLQQPRLPRLRAGRPAVPRGPQDLEQFYARAPDGPDGAARHGGATSRETTAPQVISHFNLFRSAEITGIARRRATARARRCRRWRTWRRQVLPPGFELAWAGQSLEEIKSGTQVGPDLRA